MDAEHPTNRAGSPSGSLIEALPKAVLAVGQRAAFPLLLLMIALAFLNIQDRIDRNDPRLANAPLRSEELDFS